MTAAKRIALVTGGNKGIGLEISRNFAGAGCTVLLGARIAERGKQAVRQLEQAGLSDVHFIEIDVTKQDTTATAARQIECQYDHLDILLNNAGVNLRGDGLPGVADLNAVQRVFDTNFFNMLTVQLAYELRGTKIKVNSANPGYTKTDLNDNQGIQPVEVGAIEATRLALLDDDGPTGQSFSKDGPDPW